VALHKDLKVLLEEIPCLASTILTNSRRKPWTVNGFKASWQNEPAA
jgi:hypothetical protein